MLGIAWRCTVDRGAVEVTRGAVAPGVESTRGELLLLREGAIVRVGVLRLVEMLRPLLVVPGDVTEGVDVRVDVLRGLAVVVRVDGVA